MISDIPASIQRLLKIDLAARFSENFEVKDFSFISGGCINPGGRLITSAGNFFLKWNSSRRFPGMFQEEAKGLRLLSKHSLHVPKVIACGHENDVQYLLLSYTESKNKNAGYWQRLGEGLAEIHRHRSDNFGFDSDNYIGSLKQCNKNSTSWPEFFIQQRLWVQLELAESNDLLDVKTLKKFENLFTKLDDILLTESPSLLHGDLWSGNVMVNEHGLPSLIDPAVYFGHREMDLGMTRLFGGFAREFYEAYNSAFPLQPGYEERILIYNLYPLLVHVNLFGGSYVTQVKEIVSHFC